MIEQEIAGRTAWFAQPNGSPRGAVVVCHGGPGLGLHERGVIERLAALGYAAVAPDLYGVKPTVEMIKALVADPPELRARVLAAVEHVRAHGRVAVIGYCFGGTAALEAARSGEDIACAVAFHGGLTARQPAARIVTRVLACCGGADPHCPPEQRAAFEAEMTAASADWQLHVYGGALHAFTVRGSEKISGCAYDERADRRSWAAMLELFDETIHP
jgi:dienelactone hydrolase